MSQYPEKLRIAFAKGTQPATIAPNNATTPATEAQPKSLKALLHRHQERNNPRNKGATTPLKEAQLSPSNNPQKVALVADSWGRRQCKSCDYWRDRCTHKDHLMRDAFGFQMLYRPDEEHWWRCQLHSDINTD